MMNKTLLEKLICMTLDAGLPKNLWAEAMNTACHITNRSPSAAVDLKLQEEVCTDNLVDYSVLKTFRCPYFNVQSGEQSKLDPKLRKCIFLDYEKNVKGYRLLDHISKKKVVRKYVVFHETCVMRKNEDEPLAIRIINKLWRWS